MLMTSMGEMDAHEVVAFVAETNDRDDAYEGPVPHRILRYRSYRLVDLPVSVPDVEGWAYDGDLVVEYAGTPGDRFPPVVFDPVAGTLIDGCHRLQAAILRGDATLSALVGVVGSEDPGWIDPDDFGDT